MKRLLLLLVCTLLVLAPGWASKRRSHSTHTSHATHARHRTHRSLAAKNSFKRQHPCPSTGKRSGPCPGYVIDHVKPLACGGADAPGNMQWQTVTEGRAKDKWERKNCK